MCLIGASQFLHQCIWLRHHQQWYQLYLFFCQPRPILFLYQDKQWNCTEDLLGWEHSCPGLRALLHALVHHHWRQRMLGTRTHRRSSRSGPVVREPRLWPVPAGIHRWDMLRDSRPGSGSRQSQRGTPCRPLHGCQREQQQWRTRASQCSYWIEFCFPLLDRRNTQEHPVLSVRNYTAKALMLKKKRFLLFSFTALKIRHNNWFHKHVIKYCFVRSLIDKYMNILIPLFHAIHNF